MKRSLRSRSIAALSALFVLFSAAGVGEAMPVASQESASHFLHRWYDVYGRGSGAAVLAYGTLGGSAYYKRAYRMTTDTFRKRVSKQAFLVSHRTTAYTRLAFAIPAEISERRATFFVEEARDEELSSLPATVRYYGFIDVSKSASGTWAIDRMALSPDRSTISLRDGGHGSEGRGFDVAVVVLQKRLPQLTMTEIARGTRVLPQRGAHETDVLFRDARQSAVAVLAHLTSGAYHIVAVRDNEHFPR